MSIRRVSFVPLLVLALAPGSALAATRAHPVKPVCHIVVGTAAHTYLVRNAPGVTYEDPALHITSADVATNGQLFTMVIRVIKLTAEPATSPMGAIYQMTFNVGDDSELFYVNVSTGPTAPYAEFGTRMNLPAVTSVPTVLGAPSAIVDLTHNEIRASFPLSLFHGHVTIVSHKTKIFPVETTTGRGVHGHGVFADDTENAKFYIAGTPSCVQVGK